MEDPKNQQPNPNPVPPNVSKKPIEAADFSSENLTYKTMPRMKGLSSKLWKRGVPLTSIPNMKEAESLAAAIPKPATSQNPISSAIPLVQVRTEPGVSSLQQPHVQDPGSLAAMGLQKPDAAAADQTPSALSARDFDDSEFEGMHRKARPWLKWGAIARCNCSSFAFHFWRRLFYICQVH
jgi:hypothetical protein